MSDFSYTDLEASFNVLHLDMSILEFSKLSEELCMTPDQMAAVNHVFRYLSDKKTKATIDMYLRTSRLPLKVPKTFDNFDFSVIKGKHVDRLRTLPSLAAIHAHKNLAFIGPPGTGKTHLAQAYGYECCHNGLKTYFIKMSELRDRFTNARRGLVRPACLIIDEVGHCEFDKENTRLFFDMVDRRYNRQGCNNIIFTSNKNPALWKENFNEDDDLLCALDRIFDDATVFNIRGESYRGKLLERISLTTSKVTTGSSAQTPNN